MEISSPAVIAHPFPGFKDFFQRDLGQSADIRELGHKAAVKRFDLSDLGLLKHNFRDPNGIRCPLFAPGQVSLIFLEPGNEFLSGEERHGWDGKRLIIHEAPRSDGLIPIFVLNRIQGAVKLSPFF